MPVRLPDPCIFSLKVGTQLVAILNIFISWICLIPLGFYAFYIFTLLGVGSGHNNALESSHIISGDDNPHGVLVLSLIVMFTMGIMFGIDLIISIFLFNAVPKREIKPFRYWIIVQIVVIILLIAQIIIQLSLGIEVRGMIGGTICLVLIILYETWVVFACMEELKSEGDLGCGTGTNGIVYSTATVQGNQPSII